MLRYLHLRVLLAALKDTTNLFDTCHCINPIVPPAKENLYKTIWNHPTTTPDSSANRGLDGSE